MLFFVYLRDFYVPIAVDLVVVLFLDSIKAQFEGLGFHILHGACQCQALRIKVVQSHLISVLSRNLVWMLSYLFIYLQKHWILLKAIIHLC